MNGSYYLEKYFDNFIIRVIYKDLRNQVIITVCFIRSSIIRGIYNDLLNLDIITLSLPHLFNIKFCL